MIGSCWVGQVPNGVLGIKVEALQLQRSIAASAVAASSSNSVGAPASFDVVAFSSNSVGAASAAAFSSNFAAALLPLL